MHKQSISVAMSFHTHHQASLNLRPKTDLQSAEGRRSVSKKNDRAIRRSINEKEIKVGLMQEKSIELKRSLSELQKLNTALETEFNYECAKNRKLGMFSNYRIIEEYSHSILQIQKLK